MGASPPLSGSGSRRGSLRLRSVVAGRLPQRNLRDGKPSQRTPVSSTLRRHANRLSLLDYVRFQSGQERELTGATINQRVAIVDRALRIIFPDAHHQAAPALQTNYWQRAPMGIGKPRPALSRLRVKTPKRTIVPLSVDEVARFWSSFRNSRDLAIVGLMLQGLRSQEVWDLNRDDLLLSEARIRVCGKGNKTRFLPLAPEAMQLLDHYLRLERPQTSSNALFVSLKGRARGTRMTAAGLRSLFRYHRQATGVKLANPHRFRHYATSRTMPP